MRYHIVKSPFDNKLRRFIITAWQKLGSHYLSFIKWVKIISELLVLNRLAHTINKNLDIGSNLGVTSSIVSFLKWIFMEKLSKLMILKQKRLKIHIFLVFFKMILISFYLFDYLKLNEFKSKLVVKLNWIKTHK